MKVAPSSVKVAVESRSEQLCPEAEHVHVNVYAWEAPAGMPVSPLSLGWTSGSKLSAAETVRGRVMPTVRSPPLTKATRSAGWMATDTDAVLVTGGSLPVTVTAT